ncbi:DUF445 domain-containing protein [Paenibacillus beijingensis]|uniref:DUF445 domain-containing protein n=1 Tax=Paenibacillus beijingensis TaxID=1126833 RepID=A0A0D5NFA4_9BACL|nr:DUF445 domain-containing protein [Paenibacillus beijingensis]AJY73632.1 hypothetical protein VN24_02050 [Paenibacillus beijingensis]
MKTRYIAGFSLAFMAAGFIVTLLLGEDRSGVIGLLRGGFEAGLVGGIADWFAVSALFRHPLGIPIPHTSLILRNKNKIVNALISSLENELLNKESITRRLRSIDLLGGAGRFAMRLLSKRSNRIGTLTIVQSMLLRVPAERVAAALHNGLSGYFRDKDLKPVVEKAAETVIREGWDERALDYALDQAIDWAANPETGRMLGDIAQKKMQELQLGGFMGFAVQAFAGFMNEEKLGAMLQHMLLSGIKDLSTEGSEQREKLLMELRVRMIGLPEDEEKMRRLQQWLTSRLEQPDVQSFIAGRLEQLRSHLVEVLEKDKQQGGRLVLKAFRLLQRGFVANGEEVQVWEQRISAFLVRIIEDNHYRVGLLVRDNLNRLDDRELVNMLETKVGSDLQWVRVNGALCGFLIGIVLSLVSWIHW